MLIGYIGLLIGISVPIPQLKALFKGQCPGVSLGTYFLLCLALVCYLLHALYIKSIVFSLAQGINLITNGIILIVLLRRKWKQNTEA